MIIENWCSKKLPPLLISAPNLTNIGEKVEVIWPVVDLHYVEHFLATDTNEDLRIFRDSSQMKNSTFLKKSLNVTILTDTLIIRNNITLTNFKYFKLRARKVIIETARRPKVTFHTIAKSFSSSWSGQTAPGFVTLIDRASYNQGSSDPIKLSQIF